ncbi:FAD-dependent monooxygenase [Nonomuraea endophytica]|uniref:2-polyprenyl-6-methoxyphenol hydroxylase-like FAD-dependent oxidoreductase n=1 Tax=Nonomuraea endophytica TaxID=714136 RepID=A0A7W7ZY14_9ACTN|nr:FAD-dependent monooxygenase [Nonomuraea endophytica]MBB5075351.1 2-polyprenyl-6-methoxyphenol hydroxylase-like FAD-dependent oxidoreductase [Nonomuraea endophytica]
MTNILISGASVAGTATAYWLRRHGFTVTVVERAPEIRKGGYKVDIRGAALTVIERMGLLRAVRAHSTEMTIATNYDARGRVMATMDADLFGGRHKDDAEIMRGDLTELLYELTRDEVEYVFDDSITAIGEDGTVTFERSAPRRFDYVVGADGVHSNVRKLAFGEEKQFARDLGYQIAIATVPNHLGLDREEAVHLAPGRTANVYSTKQDGDAKALFMWSGEQDVHEAFAGVGWEVPKLLEAVRQSDDFYRDTLTQIHMDSWSKGRVVLVGDAGYCASPASGQGTSLALVGAYVLAGELAGGSLDGYEREMRHFVEENQKLGPTNIKGIVLASAGMIWFQLKMIKLLPRLPWKDAMIDRIAGGIGRAANAISLKNYVE